MTADHPHIARVQQHPRMHPYSAICVPSADVVPARQTAAIRRIARRAVRMTRDTSKPAVVIMFVGALPPTSTKWSTPQN